MRHSGWSAVVGAALLSGCATAGFDTRPGVMGELLAGGEAVPGEAPYPPELQQFVDVDAQEGSRNRVLNDMRAGLAAFELGHVSSAEKLFGDARSQIETIYADNPEAERARSKFVPEANKEFKGDPYERAMVGYYLGLVDLARGDVENARADFRFGENQDTMSASEVYQNDMAIMPYLRGWAYNCEQRHTESADEFALARKMARQDFDTPKTDDNLLLIAEVGSGPVKYTGGKYHEELQYRRGYDTSIQDVRFRVGKQIIKGQMVEDVYWQASTRGGRAVDKILEGKANFKETASTASAAAAAMSSVASQLSITSMLNGDNKLTQNFAGLSLLSSLFSLGSRVASDETKPQADDRSWETLPDQIFVGTSKVPGDPQGVAVAFLGSDGAVQKAVETKLFKVGSCHIAWARQIPVVAEWKELPAEQASMFVKVGR